MSDDESEVERLRREIDERRARLDELQAAPMTRSEAAELARSDPAEFARRLDAIKATGATTWLREE